MFEGWVADIIAATLGRYLDVQKDKLKISLWGGMRSSSHPGFWARNTPEGLQLRHGSAHVQGKACWRMYSFAVMHWTICSSQLELSRVPWANCGCRYAAGTL